MREIMNYCIMITSLSSLVFSNIHITSSRASRHFTSNQRGIISMALQRRSSSKVPPSATPVSKDPWKVLVKKLGTERPKLSSVGKIGSTKGGNNDFDELKCKHFDVCSGCSTKGNFTDTPVVKRAKLYFKSEDITFPIHISNTTAWRTHAKLAVQPLSRWGGLKIGLYRENSHEVEPISDCRVHHPNINIAIEELRKAALDIGVKGYESAVNGQPSQGELRYIQMSVERSTGKIQLVLVWNAAMYKDAEQTLPRLVKKFKGRPDIWHSVSVNFQTSESNAIFNYNAKAWKILWGPPTLREVIGRASFFFRPQIFRQANLDAFQNGIIPMIEKNIKPNCTIAELYSGICIIGLNMAHKSNQVLCSDSNEYVDEVFDRCADTLPEEDSEKVFYENLSAEDAIEQGQCNDAEIMIVDPPRRGLSESVLKLLVNKHESATASKLERLIYVSCGFDAFEKDCKSLLSSGIWKLKTAEGFILFPGSDHIETVAVFDKRQIS